MNYIKRRMPRVSSANTNPPPPPPPLTHHHLTQTNLLLPRLCVAGNLVTATRLATSAIFSDPTPGDLSLAPLLHSLASHPDYSPPTPFLATLRHEPLLHRHISPATAFLAAAYFKLSKPTEAFDLFIWFVAPNSPLRLDRKLAGVFLSGFFRNDMVFQNLNVLRAWAAAEYKNGGVLDGGYGKLVYMGLLKEARINEALELRKALESNEPKKVQQVSDRIIKGWIEQKKVVDYKSPSTLSRN